MEARERRCAAWMVRGASVLLVFAVGVGVTSPADAGSVFMKNGYVIQGRIVKQTPEEVVLTWPNGTITVANRFIESVVLDAGDRVKRGDLQAAGAGRGSEIRRPRSEVVLPSDLDSLVQEIAARSRAPEGPAPVPVVAPTVGGSEAAPALVVEPRPDAAAGPSSESEEDPISLQEVRASDGSIALRIPEGWSFRELGEGVWQVTGPAGDTGKATRISFVAVDGIERSIAEKIAICRRAEGEFAGLEIARETRREIGLRLGFEAIGTIERDGTRFGLRRILVPVDDRVYVIGCVSPIPIDPVVEAAIDLCLGEIRFGS